MNRVDIFFYNPLLNQDVYIASYTKTLAKPLTTTEDNCREGIRHSYELNRFFGATNVDENAFALAFTAAYLGQVVDPVTTYPRNWNQTDTISMLMNTRYLRLTGNNFNFAGHQYTLTGSTVLTQNFLNTYNISISDGGRTVRLSVMEAFYRV